MNGIEWRETALVMVVMGLPKCFLNVMTINSVISWSDWVSKTCIYLYFQHFRWAEHNHVGYYLNLIYIRGRSGEAKQENMTVIYISVTHEDYKESSGVWRRLDKKNVLCEWQWMERDSPWTTGHLSNIMWIREHNLYPATFNILDERSTNMLWLCDF